MTAKNIVSEQEILERFKRHQEQRLMQKITVAENIQMEIIKSNIISEDEIIARSKAYKDLAKARKEEAEIFERRRLELIQRIKQADSHSQEWQDDELSSLGFGRLYGEDLNIIRNNFENFREWINPQESQSMQMFRHFMKFNEVFPSALDVIEKHKATLLRKRSQMVGVDEYGIQGGLDRWQAELSYFVQNVIPKEVTQLIPLHALISHIDNLLQDENISDIDEHHLVDSMSGVEFEMYCERQLNKRGISMIRNGGVGDQGVDLIADVNGKRVALQCKRYSGTIGNGAVQEVAAGMSFHDCEIGIVITNSTYSNSAQILASKLNIHLFHVTQFDAIVQLIR